MINKNENARLQGIDRLGRGRVRMSTIGDDCGYSTVIAYASWLATQPSPRTEDDFLPMIRRLGFKSLAEIDVLLGAETKPAIEEVYPFMDQVFPHFLLIK